MNNDIHAFADDVEIRVGHQHGDFNQSVGGQIQPGHLAINPDEVGQGGRHELRIEPVGGRG